MKQTRKPFWITNIAGNDTAEIYLYGYIGYSDDMRTSDFVKQLKQLCDQYKKVKLRINSNGGSVYDGLAIINAIKQFANQIEGYIDGVAASMAAVIALVLDKCYMNKYARIMTHRVSSGAYGNGDELRAVADQCDSMDNDLAELIAKKTGLSVPDAKKKFITSEDTWLTADQALKAGLIDGTYDGEAIDVPEEADAEELVNLYETAFTNKLKQDSDTKTVILI